ncbi:hypothetical protein AB6Q56_08385 [Dechloromonas sp. ARDL1]|uniref:hypothetical protein n=1 Tax=Dechloromonas sp. ARDL1 TaxID=3322121 RepID=UPI003DA76C03
MPTSQQPATNKQKPRGDAAIQISYAKQQATKKGGRPRKAVRAGGISVEQFLKLFH